METTKIFTNFTFNMKTEIVFGKGAEEKAGELSVRQRDRA